MKPLSILVLAKIAVAAPVCAQGAERSGPITQLYTYTIKDRTRFEEGYRSHLSWHASQNDRLVWYAWTVQSGLRRGLFIDGTAGATFAQLDSRPNPAADAADFQRTTAAYADPVGVETWQLWTEPSNATPLENRGPTRNVDVFHIHIFPRDAEEFERSVSTMARRQQSPDIRLTWYRMLRGGQVPAYMVMVSRNSWTDIEAGSATFPSILMHAYGARRSHIKSVLNRIANLDVETWAYNPRLSLMPGMPLVE